ncbi:hypothetical protein E2562_020788 [Oryza meyeriana var. granulata]|uniref:Uncharacterized protein n=1 Tax=Oryza meyeriana var. granulata TaxID=110450 RepID=A0A6G1CHI9_9ORYZ|nr:hypothetical protein E2562_020788 [Oryza meyeriana var. granulata]
MDKPRAGRRRSPRKETTGGAEEEQREARFRLGFPRGDLGISRRGGGGGAVEAKRRAEERDAMGLEAAELRRQDTNPNFITERKRGLEPFRDACLLLFTRCSILLLQAITRVGIICITISDARMNITVHSGLVNLATIQSRPKYSHGVLKMT